MEILNMVISILALITVIIAGVLNGDQMDIMEENIIENKKKSVDIDTYNLLLIKIETLNHRMLKLEMPAADKYKDFRDPQTGLLKGKPQ